MICDWKDSLPGVIALAKNEQGDTQYGLLTRLSSQRHFWKFWYHELVLMNRIPKIEDLPKDDKLILWEVVEKLELEKNIKLDIIRCITAINYLQTL